MDYSSDSTQAWFPGDGIPLKSWLDERQGPKREDKQRRVFFVGLDLGRKMDHSALCVAEQSFNNEGKVHYDILKLARFRLMTPYFMIANALKSVDKDLKRLAQKEHKTAWITYVMDAGGPGESVAEQIRENLPNADLWKVYLTGGHSVTYDNSEREIRLSKERCIGQLEAMIDAHTFAIPGNSKFKDAIIEELVSFGHKYTDTGADQYGASTGKHDDLIVALALSIWYGSTQPYQPALVW